MSEKGEGGPPTAEQKMQEKNAKLAAGILDTSDLDQEMSLLERYEQNEAGRKTPVYELDTGESSVRYLNMSEILAGNQYADIKFYYDTIDRVKNSPEEDQPHLVLLSGLIEGDHKHLQKDRRKTLVDGLDSMDRQFRGARELLEKASEVDAPIVYNLSDHDKRIADEYTLQILGTSRKYAEKSNETGFGVGKRDSIKHHPKYNEHYQFQVDEVYPMCLQLGRRLYTAEEMSEITNGNITEEEYFLLYNARKTEQANAQLPSSERQALKPYHRQWLNQLEEAKADLNVTMVDNVNINVTTENNQFHDWVRNDFGNISANSKKQSHMKAKQDIVMEEKSQGRNYPNMLIAQNEHESAGVSNNNEWVVSNPGMLDTSKFHDTKGSRSEANGDVARKIVNSRRRTSTPGATIHERTDEGSHKIKFFNKTLNEKSDALQDRMTIALLPDWQTGSTTARPELLAKEIDYIRTRIMGENAVMLAFLGDHMQGANYPHFKNESQVTGLISMDSQEAFNEDLLKHTFGDLSVEEVKAIDRIRNQNGNHEYNSGTTKWHGYSFITYMNHYFENEMENVYTYMFSQRHPNASKKEVSQMVANEMENKVKSHEAYYTPYGDYVPGYADIEYFGDSNTPEDNIGLLLQHSMLGKGSKGSGDIPAYQTDKLLKGIGALGRSFDIFGQGHWHHPNYVEVGDKVSMGCGSKAGLSDFEFKLAHYPTIAGNMIHIGGGEPVEVEYLSKQTLQNHEITSGWLSSEMLEEEGYRDDPEFNPERGGIYIPDVAKSGLQKKILDMQRGASSRENRMAEIR